MALARSIIVSFRASKATPTSEIFMRLILLALFITITTSGCGLIYKADIQQGNLIDQDMVNDLRPGMTKRQVVLVLGTPAIESPFHHDRWQYISTYDRRGERVSRKHLLLTFEQNRLVRIEGDYKPEDPELVRSAGDSEDQSS